MQVVRPKRSLVINLVLINVAIFLVQISFKGFNGLFALNSANVATQPWQLITHMFMHSGINHLLFNMYALFIFGPLIEKKIDSKRFLWFYMITGVVAALSFVAYDYLMLLLGQSNMLGVAVGASGAIMGVIGLVIMLYPNMKILFFFVIPMSMRTAGIIFALIDLVGLFNTGNGVANIAHLGGLVCGLAYGWYLKGQKKKFTHEFTKPKYSSRVHKSTDPKNVVIELSDDDVNSYLKNGRI